VEIKHFRLPVFPASVKDERGHRVHDLTPYVGRRIKRTRRIGREILAIVEGSRKGHRGVVLIFASFDDFDRCVVRSMTKKLEATSVSGASIKEFRNANLHAPGNRTASEERDDA
jgi:hypothetical protein